MPWGVEHCSATRRRGVDFSAVSSRATARPLQFENSRASSSRTSVITGFFRLSLDVSAYTVADAGGTPSY
jgi:hypothetical protein